ncbi:MAG: cation:proton antiporter [Chloroflexota bacterium]
MDLDLEFELGLGVLALAVAGYGLVAALLARRSVSSAFVFLVIGALLGGGGVGMMSESIPDRSALGQLAEVTLALVLFSAASTVNVRTLEDDARPVLRLLAIGLPLTIIAGTLLALGLFPGITIGLALLIGTALAPTDADLGQQVITDRSVPARIRRLLNIESGLNDGIAAPVVTIAIVLATVGDLSGSNLLFDALTGLVLAAVLGIAIGAAGGWLLVHADAAELTTGGARKLTVLALAMAAYFIAVGLGASGFIAAFFAGLGFGIGTRHKARSALSFTEAQSVLLSIFVWIVFGIVVLSDQLNEGFDAAVVSYALLALTVLRMIPVAVALAGEKFDRVTVAFIGWFGPRGLASMVFAILGLESLEAAGVATDPLGAVVAWTVLLSVILHGFTARPLARWYGRYSERLADESPEFLGDLEPQRKGAMLMLHHHHAEPDQPSDRTA